MMNEQIQSWQSASTLSDALLVPIVHVIWHSGGPLLPRTFLRLVSYRLVYFV